MAKTTAGRATARDKWRAKFITSQAAKRERQKAALAIVTKDHGKEAVSFYSPETARTMDVRTHTTGFQEINDLLTGDVDENNLTIPGTGSGFPRGRIIEVYGPEAAGKTTFVLQAFVAPVQQRGGVVAFIDAEHALDLAYAKALGVDIEALMLNQPDNGEQAIQIAVTLVKSKAVDLVVFDSVAALTPEKELAGDVGDSHMGLHARLMGQACRQLSTLCAKTGITVVFLNQLRMKLGVMFGNPETTPGGKALPFFASVRIDVRKMATLKKTTRIIGIRSRIRTVKNKVARPSREVYVDMIAGKGIVELHHSKDGAKGGGDNEDD